MSIFIPDGSVAQLILQVLGTVTALIILYRISAFVFFYFFRPSKLSNYLIDIKRTAASKSQLASGSSESKSWGLVTGASDGIGKALANQLAQAGFNVVLHGRNPTKLDDVRKSLQEANRRTYFKVLVADASDSHGMKSAIEDTLKTLDGLPGPLTVLINNVGGTAPIPRVFYALRELEYEQVEGLIALNCRFAVQLTRALIPGILKRNKDYGIKTSIINIGSAAQLGVPMQTVYGGSKGFLRSFTCALSRELRMEGYAGVSATYLVVGHVTNAGPWREPPTLFTPTADVMARNVLRNAGCSRAEVTPYWAHALQIGFANSLSEALITKFMSDEVRRDIEEEERKAKSA